MADFGRDALAQLRVVLAKQPAKDNEVLSEATRNLGKLRESLITAVDNGAPAASESLSHLNAIIAVVMAMHFPLGTPPWGEFEKALGWLSDLVGSEEVRAA